MKTLIKILFLSFVFSSNAQNSEFTQNENGLIYSEVTMNKLKHIVDSLNLKYKVCNLSKKYYSVKTAKANYVSLSKKDVKSALRDIKDNITYDDFAKRYPKAKFDEDKIVTVYKYFDEYQNKNKTYYSAVEFKNSYQNRFGKDDVEIEPKKGEWIFEYHEKTSYSEESIDAFYFVTNFNSKQLPDKYSKLIQYADCLIDTTATVFLENAKDSGVRYYDTLPSKVKDFNDYVDNILKKPTFEYEKINILYGFDTLNFDKPWKRKKISKKKRLESEKKRVEVEKEFDEFHVKLQDWESKRISRIDSLKQNDKSFMFLLNQAYNEAIIKHNSDDYFEEKVALFISKEAALELKRNRRVIGGCSMDDSPRIHALQIAMLSAETAKWNVFLKSHLNIMNDRFDRVSDGSWAFEGRQTYIKELEELNINVMDLMFGIALKIENPAENHYFGSINRLGRALAESKDKLEFEERAFAMIEDEDLDILNRVMIYFLFDNYNYNIKDEIMKNNNNKRLNLALKTLPSYVYKQIELK